MGPILEKTKYIMNIILLHPLVQPVFNHVNYNCNSITRHNTDIVEYVYKCIEHHYKLAHVQTKTRSQA